MGGQGGGGGRVAGRGVVGGFGGSFRVLCAAGGGGFGGRSVFRDAGSVEVTLGMCWGCRWICWLVLIVLGRGVVCTVVVYIRYAVSLYVCRLI